MYLGDGSVLMGLVVVYTNVSEGRVRVSGTCCLFILVYLRDRSVLLAHVVVVHTCVSQGQVCADDTCCCLFILVCLRDGSVLMESVVFSY